MSSTIEENEVNKNNKISLAIDAGFDAQDAQRESHYTSYLSDLRNEDKKCYNFIKHLNKDTDHHYLVALSQDK